MKKIAVILLAVLGIFVLCACGNKEAITKDEFKSYFEEEGFDVIKISDYEYSYNEDGYIASESNMIVEFSVHKDKSEADVYVDNVCSSYDKKASTYVEAGNYSAHTFEEDEFYFMVTRVDNTVMFGLCHNSEKGALSKHFGALGYK